MPNKDTKVTGLSVIKVQKKVDTSREDNLEQENKTKKHVQQAR